MRVGVWVGVFVTVRVGVWVGVFVTVRVGVWVGVVVGVKVFTPDGGSGVAVGFTASGDAMIWVTLVPFDVVGVIRCNNGVAVI